jgi:hypothetical protein
MAWRMELGRSRRGLLRQAPRRNECYRAEAVRSHSMTVLGAQADARQAGAAGLRHGRRLVQAKWHPGMEKALQVNDLQGFQGLVALQGFEPRTCGL